MGSTSQAPSQLVYEAAYEQHNQVIYNNDTNNALEGTKDVPILVDDSDSEDEDEVPQYGSDVGQDNDPVLIESERTIQQHLPKPLAQHEIAPDHFVVEKILNHKGTAARP